MSRLIETKEFHDDELYEIKKEIFDDQNRLICELNYSSNGKLTLKFINIYDSFSNLIEKRIEGGICEQEIRFNEYDTNNNLIKETALINGVLSNRYNQYKYDSTNRLIEDSCYTGDTLRSKTITKYESNQKRIIYEDDGSYQIVENDSFGESRKITKYNVNGILERIHKNEFDESGKKIFQFFTKFDLQGNEIGTYKTQSWKYDSNGNDIEDISYNSKGEIITKYTSKYNSNGKIIELICYDSYFNRTSKDNWEYLEKELTDDEVSNYMHNNMEKKSITGDHEGISLELVLSISSQDLTKTENIINKYKGYDWQKLPGNLLITAVENKNIALVKLFLDNDIGDINQKNLLGYSPLELAKQNGLTDIVKLFEDHK